MTTHDTVVIGSGAMGSATAWQLALRGRDVLLLEQFEPGHTRGASHGRSRNFNIAYAQPEYVELLVESARLWRELEAQSGAALLDQVGIVNAGRPADYPIVAKALAAVGFDAEFVDPVEAARRWPGIRFESTVLFNPQAGRLDADASVEALQQVAAAHGAQIRHGTKVLRVDVTADDRVTLEVETAGALSTIVARRVVVTAGAWSSTLLRGVAPIPQLVVTQEQPAHFAVTDESFVWPGFNLAPQTRSDYWYSGVYGMFTPGQGVKAGWHGVGPVVDPDRRSFEPEPVQFAALERFAREWLPGVDPTRAAPISCTYTTSPDSNFVLDRSGPVIVGAGFSGHGFKFTPAIGRVLADLASDIHPSSHFFAFR